METKHVYRVTADIQYQDGTLAGLLIPAGYGVNYPTRRSAQRCAAWLCKVQREKDFIRAVGTGCKYNIVGRVSIDRLA